MLLLHSNQAWNLHYRLHPRTISIYVPLHWLIPRCHFELLHGHIFPLHVIQRQCILKDDFLYCFRDIYCQSPLAWTLLYLLPLGWNESNDGIASQGGLPTVWGWSTRLRVDNVQGRRRLHDVNDGRWSQTLSDRDHYSILDLESLRCCHLCSQEQRTSSKVKGRLLTWFGWRRYPDGEPICRAATCFKRKCIARDWWRFAPKKCPVKLINFN